MRPCATPSRGAWTVVADDDDLTVVMLRGAEGVFSTGADMNNAYGWYGEKDGAERRRVAPVSGGG